MLTDQQVAALVAPFDASRVKHRVLSGKTLAYVEGWDVIATANRILGYDGWSYDVRSITYERIADALFYRAIVEVLAGDACRVDVGVGDVAYARDRGPDSASADAHGTAIKGAVTDALKRALRSFGDQFGLGLYDKDDPAHDAASLPVQPATRPSTAVHTTEQQACPTCGAPLTLRSGTTKDGRPYTAWFCTQQCAQKPIWLNEPRPSAPSAPIKPTAPLAERPGTDDVLYADIVRAAQEGPRGLERPEAVGLMGAMRHTGYTASCLAA